MLEPLGTPLRRRFPRALNLGIATSLLCAALACAPQPARAPISEATRLTYQQRCALCHGDAGDGRADQAATLPARVPDWSDSAWQLRISDEEIRAVIVGGGPAARKSEAMPAHPDFDGQRELDEMVALIRSFDD